MFTFTRLPVPTLLFSKDDPNCASNEKLKGLQRFGPYRTLTKSPTFCFVFPDGRNQDANALYLALRNGIGYFKGFPTIFKTKFERSQVSAVTGFSVPPTADDHTKAKLYADAILNFLAKSQQPPDLFFLLHDRTPSWQELSPYHHCKHVLLAQGIVSQSVTFDLLQAPSQFEWSAANIALAAFCKLGGIPWVAAHTATHDHLVIGVGRAEVQDPATRDRRRRTAFTTCLTGGGEYHFTTVSPSTGEEASYLAQLTITIESAIAQATALRPQTSGIALHVTKDFSTDEMTAVTKALPKDKSVVVDVLKVNDEPMFFAVDPSQPTGIPERGTCIRLSGNEHILYTEGRDDPKTWRDRIPTAVRVRDWTSTDLTGDRQYRLKKLLSEVLDLSQVNFRGFNATSRPAPLVYSKQVARQLEYAAENEDSFAVHSKLLHSMWFL